MSLETDIRRGELALTELDPELGTLITMQRPLTIRPRDGYFFSLCRSIIGQQVSVATASTIFGRLQTLTALDPVAVADLTDEAARAIGLSRQKISYIRDLAHHFVQNPDVYNHLDQSSDEDVITELTAIKGIGVWTAQMFLMFTLHRLDIFAPDDIGLQRAMKLLYGWDDLPDKSTIAGITERWRPYRTVACWHLWESLHNSPA